MTPESRRLPNGQAVDIHRPGTAGPHPTVLFWHGVGPDERAVLRPVAEAISSAGAVVLVPDWRSDEPDRGRAHLLASLEHARREAVGSPLVVAGWSGGAGAAVGLATRPDLFDGWRPHAVVGIAGRYDWPARTTGSAPLDDLAARLAAPVPVRLVHGTEDVPMDVRYSREFAAALNGHGWPVDLEEPVSDHAGVIMGEFDPSAGHIVPSALPSAVAGGKATVAAVLGACGLL
ncbi:alpha/beta hydrolase family protein [Streptomyces sp. NPDC002537]